MKLHAESPLSFARDLAFRTYRDRLVELVPFLPNVRGISVRSRDEQPPVVSLVNEWRGGGDVPAAARAVLSEKMLSWTDYARWDESEWTCRWRIEAHSFTDAIRAEGVNRFEERPGGCALVIDGDLAIDGRKLPVPRLLASTVASAAEKFLVAVIRPNLVEVSKGLARFLEEERKKAGG